MSQQVDLDSAAATGDTKDNGTLEIAPDIAYRRLIMVNVVFYGKPGASDRNWVLIDAGLLGTKALIKTAAEERFGKDARPSAIILTHGHFDHVGVLEDLAEEWDIPVFAHEIELPYLNGKASYPPGDPSVGGGLLARLSPLYPTKPVDVSARLHKLPDDGTVPHMPGWRWIHTPGHSVGHVSLWREADRTMIVGDAFVTTAQESVYAVAVQSAEMHGPPRYLTVDWEQSRSSVATLAKLDPELVITGHGRAMRGAAMREALQVLATDFEKVAVPPKGRYLEQPARASDGSAYLDP